MAEVCCQINNDQDLLDFLIRMAEALIEYPGSRIVTSDDPRNLLIGFACITSNYIIEKVWKIAFKEIKNLSFPLKYMMQEVNNRNTLSSYIPIINIRGIDKICFIANDIFENVFLKEIDREWERLYYLIETGHRCIFAEDCLMCIEEQWDKIIFDFKRLLANQKSKMLLTSFLNTDQRASLEKNDGFIVSLSSGSKYRIGKYSVDKLDNQLNKLGSYCIVSKISGIPVYDIMLAKKLLLQTNETEFTTTGIYTEHCN